MQKNKKETNVMGVRRMKTKHFFVKENDALNSNRGLIEFERRPFCVGEDALLDP